MSALDRIAEIQAKFGAPVGGAMGASNYGRSLGTLSSSSSTDFAKLYSQYLGTDGTSPTSVTLPTSGLDWSAGAANGALPAGTPYADLFTAAAARYGLPPRLLAAVAQVESNFNPSAVSAAGAQGLMQFMPGTAAGMGVDATDPASAIDGAARLLSGHLAKYGSVAVALAAYNAGSGTVDQYGGVPPFSETQAYVAKVLALMSGGSQ